MSTLPTERFSNRVADYVRSRPRYPRATIAVLQAGVGLRPDWVIADLGSGTGFSAELFLEHGNTVFGIEPNAAMRNAADALLAGQPRYRGVEGTAEATTLPAGSVDLVVAGQAFHWFDATAARTECLRILRGTPWAVLLWNTRRTDTPFLRAYEELLLSYGTDYDAVRHDRIEPAALACFFGGPFVRRTLENAQQLGLPDLEARLLSSSYVPARGEPGHEPMLGQLRAIFAEHARDGSVRLDYAVDILYGTLCAGS